MLLSKFFSPLEQFDLLYFYNNFYVDNVVINFDIVNTFFVFALIFFFFFFVLIYLNKKKLDFVFFVYIYEIFYNFLVEMIMQQLSKEELKYYPLIFFIFFFILFSNLFGMLPFGFTLTAHLSITFFIAFSVNLSLIFIGFIENGIDFLKLFVPSGAPSFLLPLIVVIEVVSYLIRTFSLSIRLFANMMAGHCLIFVISSFVFSMFSFSFVMTIIPVSLIFFCIFILEFAICFLQAYVFVILICIYLNDSLHPVH